MSADQVCLNQAAEYREDSGVREGFALPSGMTMLICSTGSSEQQAECRGDTPSQLALGSAGHSPLCHPQPRL